MNFKLCFNIKGNIKGLFWSKSKLNQSKFEKYSSFHTIDWLRDLAKDRFRHRWLIKEKEKGQLINTTFKGRMSGLGYICTDCFKKRGEKPVDYSEMEQLNY